jgi:hypothetical protein
MRPSLQIRLHGSLLQQRFTLDARVFGLEPKRSSQWNSSKIQLNRTQNHNFLFVILNTFVFKIPDFHALSSPQKFRTKIQQLFLFTIIEIFHSTLLKSLEIRGNHKRFDAIMYISLTQNKSSTFLINSSTCFN